MVIELLVGALTGVLAGMGIGGGTLLILWLTLAQNEDAGIAAGINLMFFIAAAGAVSIYRWRKGKLHLRAILPAIIAGCITAATASLLHSSVDQELARKAFGILLLIAGTKELLYRPKKAR